MVQIDAGYKFIFAIGVYNGKSQDDFADIFDALRSFNEEWFLLILMADGSDAITAVFEQAFGYKPKVLVLFPCGQKHKKVFECFF